MITNQTYIAEDGKVMIRWWNTAPLGKGPTMGVLEDKHSPEDARQRLTRKSMCWQPPAPKQGSYRDSYYARKEAAQGES